MTLFPEHIAACPDCDLMQRIPALSRGETARCLRCGRTMAAGKTDSLNRTFALAVAAAIVLVIANVTPLMGLSAVGRHASTTIFGGVLKMWQEGQGITAALVAFCTVAAPTVYILFMLTILAAVRRDPAPSWAGALLRISDASRSWAMVEVMMLGILVALVKIADVAPVVPGVGMFAVFALIVLFAAMTVSFDPREVWSRIRWVDRAAQPAGARRQDGFPEDRAASADGMTAAKLGLVSCGACGLLAKPADLASPGYCPRCGRALALRRRHTIQRTWALLIAAAICYIPANLLPVMNTTMPAYAANDTIMNGVILLYASGSWPLALIVLVASVIIPLAKIVTMAYLLAAIQLRRPESRRERIRIYRFVEIIGRWSMLDVFVVTFVVALVQLQPIMSVEPGAGVVFFAAVVVLTMFAAEQFDPRLIWDSPDDEESDHD
ncbi:MAG: paraquat-inducible protein A [Smithellaceae bacterium]|jgi:paraquat-inducible protein A